MVIDGRMDGADLLSCVGRGLVSTLSPGDFVDIGDLGCRKDTANGEEIEAAAADLCFHLLCAPDLNPVVMSIVKLKALLRETAAARSRPKRPPPTRP